MIKFREITLTPEQNDRWRDQKLSKQTEDMAGTQEKVEILENGDAMLSCTRDDDVVVVSMVVEKGDFIISDAPQERVPACYRDKLATA